MGSHRALNTNGHKLKSCPITVLGNLKNALLPAFLMLGLQSANSQRRFFIEVKDNGVHFTDCRVSGLEETILGETKSGR